MTISHSQRLLADLSTKGYRTSKIRTALVEILSAHHEPITVPDLLLALSKKKISANKTTIYRELAALKHERIVQEVQFGENKKRYELVSEDHHHHLICLECDRVEDIELANDLTTIEKKISRNNRFKILNHALEFYGLCAVCQGKRGVK